MNSHRWVVAVVLVMAIASAFLIIASTHSSRALYAQLQNHEAQRWFLEEEYSRLLLEQSTWASHNRIESEAAQRLGLRAPRHNNVRIVAP